VRASPCWGTGALACLSAGVEGWGESGAGAGGNRQLRATVNTGERRRRRALSLIACYAYRSASCSRCLPSCRGADHPCIPRPIATEPSWLHCAPLLLFSPRSALCMYTRDRYHQLRRSALQRPNTRPRGMQGSIRRANHRPPMARFIPIWHTARRARSSCLTQIWRNARGQCHPHPSRLRPSRRRAAAGEPSSAQRDDCQVTSIAPSLSSSHTAFNDCTFLNTARCTLPARLDTAQHLSTSTHP
jgi:hypothetical protein